MISSLLRAPKLASRFSASRYPSSRIIAARFNSADHKINTNSFVYKYLEEGPKTVKYTAEHEWLAVFKDDTAFVGITKYASDALGDATFIELPEVGVTVEAGESIGSVESVKSASEIYSPVAGEILAINQNLESSPGLINEDPLGEAWIAQIKLSDPSVVESSEELLDVAEYDASLEDH
ncbi:glycine cleavage system H protein, mitochondrial [[Candida] railenensis]|uniref:Glycine cleavage system H protein n=1 Tax=[Candida] railenensis TaxID=45579 RepID=A0A9P0W1B9_9ASCO|nr:glycine cleavage system H protein, mitochondrial [[Candida] railenensis]